ncbi:MAG: hypothetical protein Q7S99_00795 [Parvibaculum sp.]|nr:hypothetical protein [Parvibaculum sp.]
MDTKERDAVLNERRIARMDADFDPNLRPEAMPAPEMRLANAAEYSAYQMGKIRKALERIADVLEQKNS